MKTTKERFEDTFGFDIEYFFNDYSFDKEEIRDIFTYLNQLQMDNKPKYEEVKKFISNCKNTDDETVLLLKAHCSYLEDNFNDAAKNFFRLVEKYPTTIDGWLFLSFSLLKTKHYNLALDILFNLYHFIQSYQKYNFHTLDIDSLRSLKKITESTLSKNNYIEKPIFEEEFIILSRNCNNNCLTCPNIFSLRNFDLNECLFKTEYSIEDYVAFKITKKQIKKINITGGEPTIANNFFRCLNAIFTIRPDIKVAIQTNARIFSYKKFLEKLKKFSRGISLEVAFFSDQKEIHKKITRSKEGFAQTMDGIKNILEEEMTLEINLLVNPLNYDNLEKIIMFLNKSFGNYKTFNKINLVLPTLSGNYLENYKNFDQKSF